MFDEFAISLRRSLNSGCSSVGSRSARTRPCRWDSDKEPPVRDATRVLGVGELKFDCTTNGHPKDRRGDRTEVRDGRKLPEIIVTYHDQQAVCDYLVTFRFSN